MKKIAIISPSYIPNIWNSHGRSTFNIAYGLASQGHDVNVFTYTNKLETYKDIDGQVTVFYVGGATQPDSNRKVTALPFEDIPMWNERLLPLLLVDDYDCIILNGWYGWQAAKQCSTKIISIIPFLYSLSGWLKPLDYVLEEQIKFIEKECILESHLLVAHTKKFGEKLAAYCNRDVLIIPNCHLDMSTSTLRERPKIKNQLCFVGKINSEKCLERIIRVLPELPEVQLVVSSLEKNQGYFSKLAYLAKQLDVDHNIRFSTWLSTKDVRELYKESSLAIVTSQFEPYGYNALDPMSLGTPVVVSEWSGLGEYINDENFVFSQLKTFQQKISAALAMPKDEMLALTKANKDRVQEMYSSEYVTSLLEAVL